MLTSELETLWVGYLRAETSRVRPVMMAALERFIGRLLELPAGEWQEWGKGIAAEVSDRGADIPVRFPLFERVLLPALREGVVRGERGCARWLATFESRLYKVDDSGLPEHLRTSEELLAEAVRIDPGDRLARERLVARQAKYFEYTLHELPAGVLYGSDGAKPEQCEELMELMKEFQEHVRILGVAEQYEELMRRCAFHYKAYAEYLRAGPPYVGYGNYLEERGGE